jgi:hypothetical protein
MKNKIDLNTERMVGFGPYVIDEYQVNYLFGLNDMCEKYINKDFEILELGSNDGVSTSLFSFFAKTVVAVDIKKTSSINKVIEENNNIKFYNTSFKDFFDSDGDNKYDLIYIDGNHDFDSVFLDISFFKNKIKSGGYLSGHDYNVSTPGVELAVRKHFPNNEIFVFSDSSWIIKIN